MVEISSREELRAWLEDKPRAVAVALAARAALRVVPLLVGALTDDVARRRAAIVLPVFRATAVASFGGMWPMEVIELTAYAAAYGFANHAAEAASHAAPGAATAHPAAHAAANAAASGYAHAAHATYGAVDAGDAYVHAAEAAAAAAAAFADAAAADAAAYSAAWGAIWRDVGLMDGRRETGGDWEEAAAALSREALWLTPAPPEIIEAWDQLQTQLLVDAPDEHWQVWTDWYEARLHPARPPNMALERDRVLKPTEEDWEKGPKHVNGLIAGVIAEYAPRGEADPSGEPGGPVAPTVEEALASADLSAALADFEYDAAARLIRMVPFTGDIPEIEDPVRRGALDNMLSELADGMGDLADDARDGNVRPAILNALRRYAREAGRPTGDVRPGRLWDLGATLSEAALNEDVRLSLDVLLLGNLERMVDKHNDLMRVYLAGALARARQIEDVELAPDFDPDAAPDVIDGTVDRIAATDAARLPPPDPEIVEAMRDRIAELREILERMHLTGDPGVRESLRKMFVRKVKIVGVTLVRYGVRLGQWTTGAAAAGYSIAGGIKDFHPETWAEIVALFRNLPWPF